MSTFKPNSLNCGYRVILFLSKFATHDICKYILNILHSLLRQSLYDTYNKKITDKAIDQFHVDTTIDLIFSFLTNDKESQWICRTFCGEQRLTRLDNRKITLNDFQRKIVYELCFRTDFDIKFEKSSKTIYQGGSKTICDCGSIGKTYLYGEHICETCEGSGYVRSFRCVNILLRKTVHRIRFFKRHYDGKQCSLVYP